MNSELIRVLSTLPGIILGFTIHEFMHAFVAVKLGDPTPKNQGRLTLDPRKHIEPIGFILIVILGFGWAKPVQINHSYFKKPKRDDLLVSLSGPVSNLLLALVFMLIMKIFLPVLTVSLSGNNATLNFFTILYSSAYINCVLCIFNLLPIYPLDGFHILSDLIHLRNYNVLDFLRKYSTIILLVLIITRITYYIVGIPAQYLLSLLRIISGI